MGLPGLFSYILVVFFAAGSALSTQIVKGVVGQSVTLPCTYSVHDGVTSMCWGRGWCPLNKCSNEIIWTDGHKMTFQHSDRYNLKENLSQGIVSLTIENLTEADAGIYCCRVEFAGWFNDQKVAVKLIVDQATTVTALTTLASTCPMLTTLTSFASTHPMLTTTKDQSSVSSTTVLDIVTTRPSETPDRKSWTQPAIPIGENHTVTETPEDYLYENKTVILHEKLVTTNDRLFIGAGTLAGVLLILILFGFALKRYFYNRKKVPSLSLTFLAGSRNQVERTTPEDGNHAENNVYTIEDNVYTVEDNVYMIEEENEYVVPTCNEKNEPPKIWP